MRYILWVAALLGTSGVIQNVHHLGHHLRTYQKTTKIQRFDAGHTEYDSVIHFAAFCRHFVPFHLKSGGGTRILLKKLFDHLLL